MMPEYYVVSSLNMKPLEAIGPLFTHASAMRVIDFLRRAKLPYSLSIATKRPPAVRIISRERFLVELEVIYGKREVRS